MDSLGLSFRTSRIGGEGWDPITHYYDYGFRASAFGRLGNEGTLLSFLTVGRGWGIYKNKTGT